MRSTSLAGAYLVAADVEGPGAEGDDQIGVWVVYEIDPEKIDSSMTLPGAAREFQAMLPPQPFEDVFGLLGVNFSPDFTGRELNGYQEVVNCVSSNLK